MMEKLDGKSMDIVEQNIEQLKELFPEVFSEGKIKFDQLHELLGNYVNEDEDHYNFTWHGKRKAGRLAQTPSTGTLRPCKEESVDWDTTQNLFIEGDNLEVLKLLQKSYHRQVKMIYIDPPYNTGKEFIYPDKFQDNLDTYLKYTGQVDSEGYKFSANTDTDGRYHTNWLNMMYPRLKLARNLLRDDGAIFISIDDNEAHNLRKLCDDIFGEYNFIADMVIITGANQSGEGVKIQTNTENCLVYSKNKDALIITRVDEVEESLRSLNDAPTPLDTRPDMGYTIYYNPSTKGVVPKHDYDKSKINLNDESLVYEDDDELIASGYIPIRPGTRNGKLHRWRWGIDTFKERIDEVVFKESKNGYSASFKQSGLNAPKNVLQFGSGTSEVKDLFDGKKLFDFPKGIKFLSRLVSIGTEADSIVLDFFAGSGTMADAVMRLNAEDGKARKHISVQLPEPTDEKSEAYNAGYHSIAEISKERIRRAAKKIQEENSSYKGDLGFKVFKLDSSNIKRWEADFDTLEQDLLNAVDYIKQDRSSEDVLYELLLKYGLDLTVPIERRDIAGKTVYSIGLGALVACLEKDVSMDVVNGIGALKEELQPEIMRVVFKDDGFKDDVVKTNALQTLKRYGIEDIKSL